MNHEQLAAQEDEEIKRLLDEIELGRECDKFSKSTVGRYILEQAIKLEDHAKNLLVHINLDDAEAIKEAKKLQENARVPKRLFVWLNEAILKGSNAEKTIEGELQ